MSSVERISNQIIASLKSGRQNLYWQYTTIIGDTVIDFSKDIGYLAYDFLDTDNRWANHSETIRLISRLRYGVSNDDLRKLVIMVVAEYTKSVKKSALESLTEKLAKLTGKYFINNILMHDIASLFTNKIISKIAFNSSLSLATTLGGMRSRSIYGARELSKKSPSIYFMLKKEKDLDLLYFMVSEFLDPFVDAIKLRETDPEGFNKIFINVINNLSN